jgi:photosystem II stability/assembly factor-like uncharacterized protein
LEKESARTGESADSFSDTWVMNRILAPRNQTMIFAQMHRPIRFLITVFILLVASCKKDMLQWQQVAQLNSNTTTRLNNIQFISDSICIAGGGETFYQSTVLRSTDGGFTWSAFSHPDAPKEMYGMNVADGRIYLSGIDGDVLQSFDSGKSWQFNRVGNWMVQVGGTFSVLDTGIFASTILQRDCAIIRLYGSYGIIDQQTFQFGLNKIYMVSARTGYVIGYGAVMKTTDLGATWVFQDVKGDNFTAMDIHGSEIWMCGAAGGIYHTIDGGKVWERLRNGNDISLPRYYLRSIVFKDSNNGWAVGDDGKMIYTNDGGKNWAEYKRFTEHALRSITLCPNGDLLVCGDGGALYRISK